MSAAAGSCRRRGAIMPTSGLWHRDQPTGSPTAGHARWRDLVSALDWLPLASLILAEDGTALAANQAWAALSAAPPADARGDGWLSVVDPADRAGVQARLRAAAAGDEAGAADYRLSAGASRRSWSRWWWRPGPLGQVIACVAEIDDHGPPGAVEPREAIGGTTDLAEALGLVVHRLFSIGLVVQSEVCRATGPASDRLQRAVDELDELIRDARVAAFRSRRPPGGR
jgi:hypothetical protein